MSVLPAWYDHAACRDMDPDLFFPAAGGNGGPTVRQVCGTCPAQPDCLTYALDRPDLPGVWGGYGERARTHLRHRKQLGARPAARTDTATEVGGEALDVVSRGMSAPTGPTSAAGAGPARRQPPTTSHEQGAHR